MRIILTCNKQINPEYSLEFGFDGGNNYDHHDKFSNNPAPCNNPKISKVPENAVVYVNHIDADNFIGLMRMKGIPLPAVNMQQVETIDTKSSFFLTPEERVNRTSAYYVGIGQLTRLAGIPRVTEEETDITELVEKMLNYHEDEIVRLGYEAIKKFDEDFNDCIVETNGDTILLEGKEGKALNVALAYERGYSKAVVFRPNFKTVSVYGSPTSGLNYAKKTIAGILFDGHPTACGSPRGEVLTLDDAKKVYLEII